MKISENAFEKQLKKGFSLKLLSKISMIVPSFKNKLFNNKEIIVSIQYLKPLLYDEQVLIIEKTNSILNTEFLYKIENGIDSVHFVFENKINKSK